MGGRGGPDVPFILSKILERCLNRTDELSYDQVLIPMSELMINLLYFINYTVIGHMQYHTFQEIVLQITLI